LFIDHIEGSGGVLNSKFDPGFFGSYWQQYTCDIMDDLQSNFPHWDASLEGNVSDTELAVEAAARTSPSRPHVDIPANILELGSIVDLIRTSGTRLIERVGSSNLRLQFGILPLVGDLAKLADFQDQVARRIKILDRLASPKGLRKTVLIDTYSGTASDWKTMQSNRGFYALPFNQITTRTIKVHCRWLPTVNYGAMSLADKQRLAFRAVLGLTVDFSTLWEAMPWSWLVDWGSNVGDWFQANRNLVPATLSGVHVMRESHTEYTTYPWESDQVTLSAIRVKRMTKTRGTASVAPSVHFPFLDGRQMGILASLAVTRRR
jgi:hypothetical protein